VRLGNLLRSDANRLHTCQFFSLGCIFFPIAVDFPRAFYESIFVFPPARDAGNSINEQRGLKTNLKKREDSAEQIRIFARTVKIILNSIQWLHRIPLFFLCSVSSPCARWHLCSRAPLSRSFAHFFCSREAKRKLGCLPKLKFLWF
jgi:hypothetical protein